MACVTLREAIYLSETQFPPPLSENNNMTFQGFYEDEETYIEHLAQ